MIKQYIGYDDDVLAIRKVNNKFYTNFSELLKLFN